MQWIAWGKLRRNPAADEVVARLDLTSHCLDVAAVCRGLLELPTVRKRLEQLGGRTLSLSDVDRLTALAFLHDIGKASRGFQSKALSGAARSEWLGGGLYQSECGHVREVGPLFMVDAISAQLIDCFPIESISRWHADGGLDLLLAAISHHGSPLVWDKLAATPVATWKPNRHYDPFVTLAELGDMAQSTWPDAFGDDAPTLPRSPEFIHAFAGMVSLADWIGSEASEAAFPYDLAPTSTRWAVALERAHDVLRHKRIDLEALRSGLKGAGRKFGDVFCDPISAQPFAPNPLQSLMSDLTLGRLLIAEAETGSGKTEAALWRYKTLFEAGEVDSLAFVLPTRISAVQIEQRIDRFMKALFRDSPERPSVVLAVPGYLRVDGVNALERLAGFEVLWPDRDDDQLAHRRWAAENSKRYLAASCAVGTIDQVLLSGLQARHAHLRGFSLLRSLLVVDEVHASDIYMSRILEGVLKRHVHAGGHALLLSATLGVATRDRFLAMGGLAPLRSPKEREAAAYPSLVEEHETHALDGGGGRKRIGIQLRPVLREPEQIAKVAAEAVQRGARVLVVRNTVDGVIAVQDALETMLGLDHPALFRCNGVICPHHGRFAAPDRRQLDEAVNAQFGKGSVTNARVLCGSQTLEQSLDIDADLLITDLAPIDVLLQRFGRLHRHADRPRPPSYEQPTAIVLTPDERDLGPALKARRGSGWHGIGSVYANIVAIEATWTELEKRANLDIPQQNRELVERCTDPDTLHALAESKGGDWPGQWQQNEGKYRAQGMEAEYAALDWSEPWDNCAFGDTAEERVRTRLGTNALQLHFSPAVTSPFDQRLDEIAIPAWMLRGLEEQLVAGFETTGVETSDGIRFSIMDMSMIYSRTGLSRASR